MNYLITIYIRATADDITFCIASFTLTEFFFNSATSASERVKKVSASQERSMILCTVRKVLCN